MKIRRFLTIPRMTNGLYKIIDDQSISTKAMRNYFISGFSCFTSFDKIQFSKLKTESKQTKGSVIAKKCITVVKKIAKLKYRTTVRK